MLPGDELFTGLHSSVTIEIGNGSFVTANQFTNIVFDKVRSKADESFTEFILNRGYAVVYSNKDDDQLVTNKIIISSDLTTVEFNRSGGDIYIKEGSGVIVQSFIGNLKVTSKIKNIYLLRKNQVCGIREDGILLENDYFIKNKFLNPTINYYDTGDLSAYFESMGQYFTEDKYKSDYSSNLNP